MRRTLFLAICALTALLAVAGAASPRSPSVCVLSWSVVPGAAVPGGELHSVAAAGPHDAWAVGGPSNWGMTTPRPTALTEHWDGAQWIVVPSPAVAGVLEGVAIAAHDDVWAVGELGRFGWRAGSGAPSRAFAEHWDGSAWTQVAVPGMERLSGVAASGRDVWAVGSTGGEAFVLRWSGSHWTPAVRRTHAELFGVVAVSANDVWAVGDETGRRFLELHWDGKRWSSYSQRPPKGWYDPELLAVAAVGHDAVWAVGDSPGADGSLYANTIVLRWNGSRWRSVSPLATYLWVDGLGVRPPGTLWLAGLGGDVDGYIQAGEGPVLERLSGGRWQTVVLDAGDRIDGFGDDRAGGLWAVGFTGSGIDENNGFPVQTTPLIERARCS